MVRIILTLLIGFVSNQSFAGSINNCIGTSQTNNIEFQVVDSWEIGHVKSQIVFHRLPDAVFEVVYSHAMTLVAVSKSEVEGLIEFPVSLIELKWDRSSEMTGEIRIGQKLTPRNSMGKHVPFQIQCSGYHAPDFVDFSPL